MLTGRQAFSGDHMPCTKGFQGSYAPCQAGICCKNLTERQKENFPDSRAGFVRLYVLLSQNIEFQCSEVELSIHNGLKRKNHKVQNLYGNS